MRLFLCSLSVIPLTQVLRNIVLSHAYLFVWVEDVVWVKEFFDLLEEVGDDRAVLFLEVWRADDTVVVLCGDRTMVLQYEVIDFVRQLQNNRSRLEIFEIHERDDVEVAVPWMSCNRIREIICF